MSAEKGFFKRLLKSTLDPLDLFAPFMLRREGALKESGWFRSYRELSPLDRDGNPIPWVTYPFIDFITPRLKAEFVLFEFGSGNSTIFYSQRVARVTVVEHDREWYRAMQGKLSAKVTLLFAGLDVEGEYSKTAASSGCTYDILIVDGRDRVNCMINSLSALKENGVLVLDDSERSEYIDGISFLKGNGFKAIDFWGMAPGLLYKKCTTLFYREQNCLGL